MERLRHQKGTPLDNGSSADSFIDPFSYESSDDARVQLELENRFIPFSYRYFDGEAPTLKKLLPAYEPEFTLREYKVVIIVVSSFFGALPGALNQAALASVLLEKDGWKQVAWYENEIKGLGVNYLIQRDLPELNMPVFQGPERPSPVGHPLTMETRRRFLRGMALLRKLYTPKTVEAASGRSVGIRLRFIRRSSGDTGRVRAGGKSHPKVVD